MHRMWQGYFSMTVLFLVCTDGKVIRFTLGYSNVMKPGLDESIDMGYLVGSHEGYKYGNLAVSLNVISLDREDKAELGY